MDDKRANSATVALLVAILAAFFSFAIYIIQPGFTVQLQITLGIMVLSLIVFVVIDPGRVKNLVRRRQARYGTNSVVLTIAMIGIVIVVNVVIFQNADDWGLRWDLTADKENTLAPESIEILESLTEPVTALAFFGSTQSDSVLRTKDLLDNFKFFGRGNFKYSVIDPDDPQFLLLTEQLNVTREGTIVLRLGERSEKVILPSEQNIDSALVKLLNPSSPVIYFLSGHGEHPLEGAKEISYNEMEILLEAKNYQVKNLSLIATNDIPTDAALIVVGGPVKSISSEEIDLLREFSNAGGALMVFYDPSLQTENVNQNDPLLDYLADDWGMMMQDDIIFDQYNGFNALAADYGPHPISEEIDRVFTVFPVARSLQFDSQFPGVTYTDLIQTSEISWAETNLESVLDQTMDLDENDSEGPLSLAVLAENALSGARLIVVGDSDFAVSSSLQTGANSGLITAMTDWVLKQEGLLTLSPRLQTQRFVIPPSQGALGLVLLLSVFVIPGTVLGAGLFVWARRRQKK